MKNHRHNPAPIKRRKTRHSVMKTQRLLLAALRLWELKHKYAILRFFPDRLDVGFPVSSFCFRCPLCQQSSRDRKPSRYSPPVCRCANRHRRASPRAFAAAPECRIPHSLVAAYAQVVFGRYDFLRRGPRGGEIGGVGAVGFDFNQGHLLPIDLRQVHLHLYPPNRRQPPVPSQSGKPRARPPNRPPASHAPHARRPVHPTSVRACVVTLHFCRGLGFHDAGKMIAGVRLRRANYGFPGGWIPGDAEGDRSPAGARRRGYPPSEMSGLLEFQVLRGLHTILRVENSAAGRRWAHRSAA